MFIKPFKIKSNVQLKSSERKKLRDKLIIKYPTINNADFDKLFPSKSNITYIKIITHNNQKIDIYSTDKRPMFFDNCDNLYPTVYAMWLLPDLLPLFTTHPNVLGRMANGADLMLPGVIKQGQGLNSYGYCKKNDIVSINLTSNRAPIAIGILAKSSEDLYMSGGVGICCKILHVYGDKLWDIEPNVCLQTPNLGASYELPTINDFPALGEIENKKKSSVAVTKDNIKIIDKKLQNLNVENLKIKENVTVNDNEDGASAGDDDTDVITSGDNKNENDENKNDNNDQNQNDVLLKNGFLTALKRDGKTLQLPILTSNFYRCHVLPAINQQIDLKQTSYRKLSKFLYEMSIENFIEVKEVQKGVEKIISINFTNPKLLEFQLPSRSNTTAATANTGDDAQTTDLFITEMTELYLVTDRTITLFTQFNYAVGDGIEYSQTRKLLKDYVRNNKLQDERDSKIIILNELLINICNLNNEEDDDDDANENNDNRKNELIKQQEYRIKFDELFSIIISKMQHTFEMRSKNEIKSSSNIKRQKIQMSLAKRSGNKIVTLVSNLEAFGIRINEFMKACKVGVAASTTLTKTASQKSDQLMVQGNQIRFVYNLLVETYKIAPKNIAGVELARKEKKKK